jgi:hypothetical protein
MGQDILFLFLVAKVTILTRRGTSSRECCSQDTNLTQKQKTIVKEREKLKKDIHREMR